MITRRDLTVAALAVSFTAAVMAFAASITNPVLHSCVFNWDNLTVVQTKMGERRPVCDNPTPTLANLEIHITTLKPGESPHPPHQHPDEELMIVKEGSIEAIQENRTNLVTVGGIIFEASNELHGLRNMGTNLATYFVIKFVPHDLKLKK